MKKSELLSKLSEQLPCFFSVEQVIKMVEEIEETAATPQDAKPVDLEKLKAKVFEAIRSVSSNLSTSDVVDTDSARFSIRCGNEIEIDEIDIETSSLNSEYTQGITEAFNEFEEEQNETDENND